MSVDSTTRPKDLAFLVEQHDPDPDPDPGPLLGISN